MTGLPTPGPLLDHLYRTAQRYPDGIAVTDAAMALTYRELVEEMERRARELTTAGVVPGDRMAVLADRSAGCVLDILGVLRSGAAYVPLDGGQPVAWRAAVSEDAQVRGVPGDEGLSARPPLAPSPDGTAYIMYTSGSTGRPKGCVVSQANVAAFLSATAPMFDFRPGDRWAVFHSLSFDASVWELWGALATGGTAVMIPRGLSLAPGRMLGALREIEVLSQVPSVLRLLVRADRQAGRPPLSVRHLFSVGEAIDLDAVAAFRADRPINVANMYGPTETTVFATAKIITEGVASSAGSPIGRPLPHARVLILDESRAPLADGTAGEIVIGGAGVAAGYWNRPEATRAQFIDIAGRRCYRTGDQGVRLPTGDLLYLGRRDTQIKLRGYRIELTEIEHVLRGQPEVEDVVVCVVPDLPGGDALVACVAGAADPRALRRRVAALLPHYLRPDRYLRFGELPANRNGKRDRIAAREQATLRLRGGRAGAVRKAI